jgi:hypothetical protein
MRVVHSDVIMKKKKNLTKKSEDISKEQVYPFI